MSRGRTRRNNEKFATSDDDDGDEVEICQVLSRQNKRKLSLGESSNIKPKIAKTGDSSLIKSCTIPLLDVCSRNTNEKGGLIVKEDSSDDSRQTESSTDVPTRRTRSRSNGIAIVKPNCSDVIALSDNDSDDFQLKRNGTKKTARRKKLGAVKGETSPKVEDGSCPYCGVRLDDDSVPVAVKRSDAVEETMLVGNQKFELGEAEVLEFRLSDFSFYDANKHLCPLKSGILCKHELWFSGRVRRIDDDQDASDGLCVYDAGPISEWWIAGYEGGEEVLVAVSSEIGDYYMTQSSPAYMPFYHEVLIRAFLTKYVIELVREDPNAAFTDLLEKIQSIQPPRGLPPMTAETLITFGEFVISQVVSFDRAADPDEYPLMLAPCMIDLMNFTGSSIKCCDVQRGDTPRGKKKKDERRIEAPKPKTAAEKKATTTPLVFKIMQACDVFQMQISDSESKERCGNCVKCNQPDCGKCSACRENKSKKSHKNQKKYCLNKMCLIQAFKEVEVESEDESTEDQEKQPANLIISPEKMMQNKKRNVKWLGKPVSLHGKESVYLSAKLDGETIEANDYVMLNPEFANEKFSVARIVYMFENKSGKLFHAHYFRFSKSTILGHMAAENELCMSELCADVQLQYIRNKCNVEFKEIPADWRHSGGQEYNSNGKKSDNNFYYQKWYQADNARFVDPPVNVPDDENAYNCAACCASKAKDKLKVPKLDAEMETLNWMGNEYKKGDCVYYTREDMSMSKKTMDLCAIPELDPNVDENRFPEYYRKRDTKQGLFVDSPQPFLIGQIIGFQKVSKFGKPGSALNADDVKVDLEIFYRPEDTHLSIESTRQLDYNLLYWTGIVKSIKLSVVTGKCFVIYGGRMFRSNSLDSYFAGGPDRFYFLEGYSKSDSSCFKVSKQVEDEFSMKANLTCYPVMKKKLTALDVFCGCGGLSEGFHQSGLTETKWAIENDKLAAEAFQLNNPDAIVFNEDCNVLLKQMIEGKTHDGKGKLLPKRGEVDLILGGPPCQGYSGMNRFNHRQYSAFKNSLVVTYLSFVEHLRPKFFLLENVRNFASFKKGDVLKCCLRALTEMGYQVTFGVLQAGNYGVPQTRKRAFVIAAAPGEKLPLFPEPTHVFIQNSAKLCVRLDGVEYRSNVTRVNSAPFRQVTVYDSISDLPPIENGDRNSKMDYAELPKTHFQRMIRCDFMNKNFLYDHVCKEMNALNVARFSLIPIGPGSDWRDLPNIELNLPDGSKAVKLKYKYDDMVKGRANNGAKRGVCLCAESKHFTGDHLGWAQDKTLIPWCLPHTSNRHNNWAGLFGRLHWYGYFGTTITNPEPMGKMGYVIHTVQNRIVSVRECARSQGFPDSFKFTGQILDKYKQIGNAVPPPLARAIAIEIAKCVT